jgi:hypothetical protein
MRHLLPAFCVVAVAAAIPCGAAAQSIVDLSKPQTGKARFVLNADLTPATLGAPEENRTEEIPAAARVPACGEGCRMQQPDLQKSARAAQDREPGSSRSGNRTRVFILAGGGRDKPAPQASQQKPAPRKTFRFRRR